jgi:hypothetical protein
MAQKKNSGPSKAVVAGIMGLTAAAIGAYYLYGHKDAEKNRAKVKGWMLKAKGEVLDELEKVQDVTESVYMAAVDAVAKRYNELKNIDAADLEIFIKEMKNHWQGIKKTMSSKPAKQVKRVVKPAPKKNTDK